MKKIAILFSIILLISAGFLTSNAQVKVALKLDESEKSVAGRSLFCDKNFCGLDQNENSKISRVDDLEVAVKVLRTGENFYLLFDTNRDAKLTDEKKILIAKNSQAQVKIRKKASDGNINSLSYKISHQVYKKDGLNIDGFNIIPNYVKTGTLRYKNCSSKISISDMNFDGEFTIAEADGGTNLKIDRNNDGKFWGKEEYQKTNEIIEFCGQNFLVSSLNEKYLSLTPTNLQIAKIGQIVPNFSVVMVNGKTFSSDNLKGKYYVLDFWASWCVPCVENLSQIKSIEKEFGNKLSILSINVDGSARKDAVHRIIDKYQISNSSAVRGLGDDDPMWKTFGGANLNNLAIPLYVLVDKNGVIQYVGNGGAELNELKRDIRKLFPKQ